MLLLLLLITIVAIALVYKCIKPKHYRLHHEPSRYTKHAMDAYINMWYKELLQMTQCIDGSQDMFMYTYIYIDR